MIGALACNPHAAFDSLCTLVAQRDPTGVAGPAVEHLLGPVVVFAVLVLLGRGARRLLVKAIVRAGGDAQVRSLVENVVTAATFIFATLAALVAGGLDIGVLLTFGGLASLAVGLAFQDVLRNLLAGIFLLVEKPFRLGDQITVESHTGVVQTIELRTTTLRTADGRMAILPNLTAFNSIVVNQSAFDTRQYTVSLRVPPQEDLEAVVRAVRTELERSTGVTDHPPPSLVPHLDGDKGVVLDCRYWLDYRSYDPDAVTVEVAQRLWSIAGVRTPG
ncbi:MAG: mechanosensitive ion channel family protein [Candidatus Dormibacteria bacterium]